MYSPYLDPGLGKSTIKLYFLDIQGKLIVKYILDNVS